MVKGLKMDEVKAPNRNRSELVPASFKKPDYYFWVCIALAFLVGAILRLYMISDQILLDDEWHGIDYVPGKSLYYLFAHWGRSANCIPMNLYRLLLLNTIGWSEWLLKIPSLVPGILGTLVFPVLLKKIINLRATIIFSFLWAISPLLVYYSRISRGYSMVAFLAFFSALSIVIWIINGKSIYAVCYVISSGFAVYFNLFAIVGVLSPLGFIFLIKLKSAGLKKSDTVQLPNYRNLILVVLSVLLIMCILLIPCSGNFFETSINTNG